MENKSIVNYLLRLRNDIYKLLPLKEQEIYYNKEKHLDNFISTIIINIEGSMKTFEVLNDEKKIIYVLNNLNYLNNTPNIELSKWRNIIFKSTRNIDDLRVKYMSKKEG